MNLQKLDGLLTVVNDLLNIDGGASEETVAPLLQQVYKEVVGKYQPLIHALPSVAVVLTKDLVPVARTLMNISNELRADEQIQQALAVDAALKAKIRKQALEAYVGVGFQRGEAMALVLQDVANAKAALHSVHNEIPTAAKNATAKAQKTG